MIRFLQGTIHSISTQNLLLTVNGVGYELFFPLATLAEYSAGQTIQCFVRTLFREDQFVLFGFAEQQDAELFDTLRNVPWVGPKTALALLGRGADILTQAIHAGDLATIQKTPWVGKKTAERILLELGNGPLPVQKTNPTVHTPAHSFADIETALVDLWFRQKEVADILSTLDPTMNEQTALKTALAQLRTPLSL